MKFRYLGTGAAEGIPALFCQCAVCLGARERGGRDLRTRAQAIVDDDLLIDFGADTLTHAQRFGIDLLKVKTVLVTHIHGDHFYPNDLALRRPSYSHITDGAPLSVVGTPALSEWYGGPLAARTVAGIAEDDPHFVRLTTLAPLIPYEENGYRITAFPAVHGTESPYFYLIEKNGKSILYAHDTDTPCEEVFTYFGKNASHLDLVSLDCTFGAREFLPDEKRNHMNLSRAAAVKEKLLALGIADEKTVFVTNHFSHNGTPLYDDFVPLAAAHGMLVSYDGMEIPL